MKFSQVIAFIAVRLVFLWLGLVLLIPAAVGYPTMDIERELEYNAMCPSPRTILSVGCTSAYTKCNRVKEIDACKTL